MVILLTETGLPQREATEQTLAQLTISGLANMMTKPASGWVFDQPGGQWMFGLSAVLLFFVI